MIVLSKTQIKKLHEHLIKRTGGSVGVRDEGMLDSALHAPFASAFGTERYASVTEKCADLHISLHRSIRLWAEISGSHCFVC